jgi:curved DNA-binding protein CbpA
VSARRRDLYAILGLTPEATAAEITHAYRALVRRHHPDTRDASEHPAGEDADKELARVQAAYAVLRDPQLRADYDAHIDVARRRTRRRPPSAESPGGSATGDGAHHPMPKAPRYSTAEQQPPFRAGPVRWEPPPTS